MKIESSIRILLQLATRIKWISETELATFMNKAYLSKIKYNDDEFDRLSYSTSVSGICQDLLIVTCCSFIEEYEGVFNPSKFPTYANEIKKLKRITAPAYKRIKSWKDLKLLRNNIIAHNHRSKGESIYEIENRLKYNVPSTNEEATLLADLIVLITENIYPIFTKIIEEMDFTSTLRDSIHFESEKINTFNEFRKIKTEIEELKNSP
jgi:hypothetical protein